LADRINSQKMNNILDLIFYNSPLTKAQDCLLIPNND
jgi:hypothetical protein